MMDPQAALPPLVPPLRFAIVESGGKAARSSTGTNDLLFRSGYPSLINYRFLLRLKLRTIVSLLPADPVQDLKGFCTSNRIANVHVKVGKFADEVTLTPSLISQILELLINPQHHPLLVRTLLFRYRFYSHTALCLTKCCYALAAALY